MGAPMVAVALTGADQVVRDSHCVLGGYTIRETAGAVAAVRVYDNASAASGTLLATIGLAANASHDVHYPGGIRAAQGVYVDVVTGAVEGSIRIA
jgi:hypothetical protein